MSNPQRYPSDEITDTLAALGICLRESNGIADDMLNNPGIRSGIFTRSNTGQNLIGDNSALRRSLREYDRLLNDFKLMADELVAERLHAHLLEATCANRPIACVLAPMFTENNVVDGYYRRIKNIDDLIPEQYLRLYLYCEGGARYTSIREYDQDHIFVEYNPAAGAPRVFELVARFAQFLYMHSIHACDAQLLNATENIPLFLDVHGVVPEEMRYCGSDDKVVELYERRESDALKRASAVICVTESMAEHIIHKHPSETEKTPFLVMPIFDISVKADEKPLGKETAHDSPTVVYAGGIQKWQRIEDMLDAIERMGNACKYRIFVPDVDELKALWGHRVLPDSMLIGTRAPEELRDEYRQCQFGFALREDSVVNRVACPTKITEYLRYDIIPIIDDPNIGDFVRYGMRYVSLRDFLAGRLPDEDEQRAMVRANRETLAHLASQFSKGRKGVIGLFENANFKPLRCAEAR